MFAKEEISRLSDEFESKTPQEILTWAIDTFWPQIGMSSSFQTQSMPLLHIVKQIRRDVLIFFLDTGYHFWDTLAFRERVVSDWKLNVLDLYRDSQWDVFARQRTRTLPDEDPNLCCYLHKVQPMQKALHDMKAWISGIRRDQTPVRAKARILEYQDDGLLKINPLLNWTKADIEAYREEHNLPVHPLSRVGFRSIGCAPCTAVVSPAEEDDRAGRWAGKGILECGLHTEIFDQKDFNEARPEFSLDVSSP